MAQEHILVIEDDAHIAKLLTYTIEKAGYKASRVSEGNTALARLDMEKIDLIILDIMLPDIDGFEICRLIKQNKRFQPIPVIMLTARGEEVDRIVGFELGADDYIVKPFSPRELLLRIKAILRRGKPSETSPEIIECEDITIDIPKHKVFIKGKELPLTLMEFKLLTTLIDRAGRVQSRETLLSDVWGMNAEIYTRTVDTHIKRLREKLGKRAGDRIETVRGLGYRFRDTDNED